MATLFLIGLVSLLFSGGDDNDRKRREKDQWDAMGWGEQHGIL